MAEFLFPCNATISGDNHWIITPLAVNEIQCCQPEQVRLQFALIDIISKILFLSSIYSVLYVGTLNYFSLNKYTYSYVLGK